MDSTSSNSNKSKKKRRLNPLAAARGNAKRADQLWHKKTGAGFALFCEYYAQQPTGVVFTGSTSDATTAGVAVASTVPGAPTNRGAGLSRAAKRRKKKKAGSQQHGSGGGGGAGGAGVSTATTTTPTASSDTSAINDTTKAVLIKDMRLLNALNNNAIINNKKEAVRPVMTALSQPLPLTFRIRQGLSKDATLHLHGEIQKEFGHLVKLLSFGQDIYQAIESSLHKASLSKVSPALKAFLVEQTGVGTIARQELGSMLPVTLLQAGGYLDTNSRVLDLCASPGSKTLQALEVVTAGRIKANDVNESRLETLRQAVGRSGMPTKLTADNAIIKYTCQDATQFPIPVATKHFYDAIICDVPCSGDGTVRKDPHILPAWTPGPSHALHGLQIKILVRALQCLRPGGVVSYSTCSLHPAEDEAVVAAALQTIRNQQKRNVKAATAASNKGTPCVELVPCPALPGFTQRAGVRDWKIADYVSGRGVNGGVGGEREDGDESEDDKQDDTVRLTWYDRYEDASNMPDAVATMWPPCSEIADTLHLDRCIRLWPQDHDSGGFFVALIRKNW